MLIKSVAAELSTGEITLGRQCVKARALNAATVDRLMMLYPRPRPKKTRRNPNMGSLAEPIPDDRDPDYLEELRVWVTRIETLQVIIACDLAVEGGAKWNPDLKDEPLREWCDKAVTEARQAFTASQLSHAAAQLAEIIDHGRAMDRVIVEAPATADSAPTFRLPDRYQVPEVGLFLRICERYGMNPREEAGIERGDPGFWAMLIAQEKVRQAEDSTMIGG